MTESSRPSSGPVGFERTRRQLEELDALLQQMLAVPVTDDEATVEPPPLEEPWQTGGLNGADSEKLESQPIDSPVVAFHPRGASPVIPRGPSAIPAAAREASSSGPTTPVRAKSSTPLAVGFRAAVWTGFDDAPVGAASRAAPIRLGAPDLPAGGELSPRLGLVSPGPNSVSPFAGARGAEDDDQAEADDGAAISPQPPGSPAATTTAKNRSSLLYHSLVGINRAYERTTDLLGPLGRGLSSPSAKDLLGRLGLTLLVGAAAFGLGTWLGWTW